MTLTLQAKSTGQFLRSTLTAMQALLQRRAMGTAVTARNGPSGRRVPLCKRTVARSAQVQRRGAVQCKAFFNFFAPKPAAPTSPFDPRAKPLVEQLIAITSGTDAGAKASAAQKEEIAALVGYAGEALWGSPGRIAQPVLPASSGD